MGIMGSLERGSWAEGSSGRAQKRKEKEKKKWGGREEKRERGQ